MNYYIYIGAVVAVLGILLVIIGMVVGKKQQKTPAQAVIQETVQKETEPETEEVQEEPAPEEEAETETEEPVSESAVSGEEDTDGFMVNEIPEINKLLETYYAACASGDTEKLETCAAPVSELEKSYVKLMSGYTESTQNIQCYVKKGLKDGEYAVSAVTDVKLSGADVTAPGLDLFYVRTKEDGTYYIDNTYSSFNLSVHVLETDKEVMDFIAAYEDTEDFKMLQESVQVRYNEILNTNKYLKEKLLTEIPEAVSKWMSDLAGSDKKKADGLEEGSTITAKDSYNIRKSMSDSGKKLGTVEEGDALVIVKHYDGWTEVKWKDKIGYIKTELLAKNE